MPYPPQNEQETARGEVPDAGLAPPYGEENPGKRRKRRRRRKKKSGDTPRLPHALQGQERTEEAPHTEQEEWKDHDAMNALPLPGDIEPDPHDTAEQNGEASGDPGDASDSSYVRDAGVYDGAVAEEPEEAAAFREELEAMHEAFPDGVEDMIPPSSGKIMTEAGAMAIMPMEDAPADSPALRSAGFSPEILEVLDDHFRWLESHYTEGRRGDFRKFDLKGADFSGMRLAEANFRGVSLSGAKFDNADLQGVDFSDAKLTRASFSGCNLSGASLSRAEADFSNFEHAAMAAVNLNGADLRGARFRSVQLPGAVLRDASLRSAVLVQANLREAVLKNADLLEAVLEDADMTEADCRGANFERAVFTRAVVDRAEFRGANMSGTDLNATNFSHALNVDTSFQAQSYETGRQELQEDLSELEHLRQEIARREKAMYNARMEMEREKEHIAHLQSQEIDLISRLKRHIKWFKATSVIWLALAVAFISFTLNAISKIDSGRLNLLELGVLFAVVAGVMALFTGSFLSAMFINRSLLKIQRLREDGISVAMDPSGSLPPHAPPPQEANSSAESGGFGKKRG